MSSDDYGGLGFTILEWWQMCWKLLLEISPNLSFRRKGQNNVAYMLTLFKQMHEQCYTCYFHMPQLNTIYIDYWKSFIKFGIKKSHEMISYILAWIVLLSEWKIVMSTKPCNLDETTLIKLYNKSHEGFVLSKYQENASIGRKP